MTHIQILYLVLFLLVCAITFLVWYIKDVGNQHDITIEDVLKEERTSRARHAEREWSGN